MTSKDNFKLAAEIRRGEHDDEIPDYDVIVSWILRMPRTWVGGILATVVGRHAVEPFFADDEKMQAFIERAMFKARNPMSVLRDEVKP